MASEIIPLSEAKARSLPRYFTGKLCNRGHVDWRFVANRKCVTCSLFDVRKFRAANLETVREKDRENYATNPERYKEKNKNRDPIKLRLLARQWYRKNKDRKKKTHLKWCESNIERKRESKRAWHAANHEKALSHNRKRRAKKLQSIGSHTPADIAEIFKYQRGLCAYCKSKLGKKYHIDHIVPLSKGGSDYRSNLQLTCRSCNARKHAKDPLAFARECGLLL